MKIKQWGIIFRTGSLWIGGHWSDKNKRLCVNILPFVTIWVTIKGGETPRQGKDLYRSKVKK